MACLARPRRLLVVAVAVTFANVLGNDFVYDDRARDRRRPGRADAALRRVRRARATGRCEHFRTDSTTRSAAWIRACST